MHRLKMPCTKSEQERGSLLIITVLVLAAVTVIGVVATKTALVETQIAGYDKCYRMNWSVTDGTTNMLMPKVIEKGLAVRRPVNFGDIEEPERTEGFILTPDDDVNGTSTDASAGYLLREPTGDCVADSVSEDPDQNSAHLNHDNGNVLLKVYSTTRLAEGGAIQISEGYSGIGRGSAGGGSIMAFSIRGLGQTGTSCGEIKHTTRYDYVIY